MKTFVIAIVGTEVTKVVEAETGEEAVEITLLDFGVDPEDFGVWETVVKEVPR